MAERLYVGVNGYARKVSNLYVGVNDKAKRVKRAWVGINGVAQLCYVNIETTVKLKGGAYDSIKFTYNNETRTISTDSDGNATITIFLTEEEASITFKSEISNFSRTATLTAGETNTVYVRPRYSVVWYGYVVSDSSFLAPHFYRRYGNGSNAYYTSDYRIRFECDPYSQDYCGLSVSCPYGDTMYVRGEVTNHPSSSFYLLYGNSNYSEPARSDSDWTSKGSKTLTSSTESYKLSRASTGDDYVALCAYVSGRYDPGDPIPYTEVGYTEVYAWGVD